MIMKYSIFFFKLSTVLLLLLEIPEILISKLSVSFQTPSRFKWNHSSLAILVDGHKETLLSCQQWSLWWVLLESSDKMWSTGEGNGKTLQHSCLENPMNSMKRQNDMTLEDELPRSVGAQYAMEISGEITPERMKRRSQSKNNTQLWMWLVMEARSDAVKSSIAQEPGMLGPLIKANWKWSNRRWQEWTSTF